MKTLNFDFNTKIVSIYPNPTESDFNVSFTAGLYQNIKVTDLFGRVLQHLVINTLENNKLISLSNYAAGTYVVKLTGMGQIITKKILKK